MGRTGREGNRKGKKRGKERRGEWEGGKEGKGEGCVMAFGEWTPLSPPIVWVYLRSNFDASSERRMFCAMECVVAFKIIEGH